MVFKLLRLISFIPFLGDVRMADFFRILCKTTFITAVVLGLTGAVLFFLPKYHELKDREAQCDEMQRRIDAKQQEIKTIRVHQQRLQTDPAFVEQVARQSRRIRPNELVFVYDAEK
jgi:Tfp pilus assembly protein PilN